MCMVVVCLLGLLLALSLSGMHSALGLWCTVCMHREHHTHLYMRATEKEEKWFLSTNFLSIYTSALCAVMPFHEKTSSNLLLWLDDTLMRTYMLLLLLSGSVGSHQKRKVVSELLKSNVLRRHKHCHGITSTKRWKINVQPYLYILCSFFFTSFR